MAKLSSNFIPSIYEDFKDLSGAEPRELARFYENNQSVIQSLEIDEFFDLQVTYLTALFDLGSHQKLLDIIDLSGVSTIVWAILIFGNSGSSWVILMLGATKPRSIIIKL